MALLNLNKDRHLTHFFISLLILLIFLIASLFLLKALSDLQIKNANDHYHAYYLATDLEQASEDLTKMARLYVITGEKKYRDYYNEILTIREGTSPRPICYDQLYWDLVTENERPCPYGEKVSRRELMNALNVTTQEYALLEEALDYSNVLAATENRAMNAVEGKFENATDSALTEGKPNQNLAIDLLFGSSYMNQKRKIMRPIETFFQLIHQKAETENLSLQKKINALIAAAIGLSLLITLLMIYSILKALKSISQVTNENEMLILNILPQPIADRLRGGEQTIADEFPQASVLFADIVGFTTMTDKIGVTKMVTLLNALFRSFDDLTEKFKIEKVKTIGDNYMAVAGIPIPSPEHALSIADFALAIRDKVQEFNAENHLALQIRIGMTYGTVIAGVIGHKKFIYDVWGDVVNTASRMESTSYPNEIQVTEKMAFMLNEEFVLEERKEIIDVKGKGMMKTFFLKKRKAEKE